MQTMLSNPSRDLAIQVQGLTKSYGKVRALRGIDLEVKRGEIFGFLGPNGAGKTTTIRCLLDMIRPDGGKALLLGLDPQVDPVAVQACTGYLPGEMQFYDNLTVERQLRFFSDMRNGRVEWGYVRQLAERLDLDLKPQIKNLSKGNKQKIGVIQALMHRPELLLLDEPTSGLDPLMQQEVLSLLREANAAGATVFFSSHIMSEVENVAGRVAIIRSGEIVEVAETEQPHPPDVEPPHGPLQDSRSMSPSLAGCRGSRSSPRPARPASPCRWLATWRSWCRPSAGCPSWTWRRSAPAWKKSS